jgi:micrococcal nuclease
LAVETPLAALPTAHPDPLLHVMKKLSFAIFILANYLAMTGAIGANHSQSKKFSNAEWQGVVTHVSDGDTLWVKPAQGGEPIKIRVDGIDAPEICQAFGRASQQALSARVLHQPVKVWPKRRDTYGRMLARIRLAHGDDVARLMVQSGHAWSYRYRRSAGPYAAQEAQASAARLGLYADPKAEHPRDFRKRHGACG